MQKIIVLPIYMSEYSRFRRCEKHQKEFPALKKLLHKYSRRIRLELRNSGGPLHHLPGTIIIKVTPDIYENDSLYGILKRQSFSKRINKEFFFSKSDLHCYNVTKAFFLVTNINFKV